MCGLDGCDVSWDFRVLRFQEYVVCTSNHGHESFSLQKLAETAIAEDLRDKQRSTAGKSTSRSRRSTSSGGVGKMSQMVGIRGCKCCGRKLGLVHVS